MDPGYFDTDREQDPRERASILSKICFWYTNPVFLKGRKGQLSISDMYRCMPGYRSTTHGDILGKVWKQELGKKGSDKPSLFSAIFKIYGVKFLMINLTFAVFDCCVKLSIPMFLEGLINYFSHSSSSIKDYEAYLYAVGLVGFMAINAFIGHPVLLYDLDTALNVRVGCCSLVYRKLLRLDLTAGGKASEGLTGYVLTLLTTDTQRFDMTSLYMVDLLRAPILSTVIVYMMYRQIGVATLIGVAFLLLFIPLQGYLGKISSRLRLYTAYLTDNRIRLMNEMIQSIEAIKMYAWENAFAGIIGEARRKEMKVIKKISWLRAVMVSCVKLNTKVAIFLSIISFLAFKNDLTAAKVFVIFSYYDILKNSLVDCLPRSITYTLESYVSVKRLKKFLLLPEVDNQDGVDLVTIDEKKILSNGIFEKIGNGQQIYIKSESNMEQMKPNVLISLKDFTAHWKSENDGETIPALSNINLNIKPQTLTTIVGTVGSGKSTLLSAILREISPTSGQLTVLGLVAYAAQDPWLFDASVRQNILFGEELNLRRYKRVIKCCQLESDLNMLPYGDKTVVGERGSSVSGGQRARISLARCVYQQADVYLLDDPLAAVDAKVAQAIYEECIRCFLRDKATVLVTHHVQYAKRADCVCVMRAGTIVAQGIYHELKKSVPEFEKLIEIGEKVEEQKQKRNTAYETHESIEHRPNFRSQKSMSEISQSSLNMDLDSSLEPKYEGEVQRKGSVDFEVYLGYIKSGGSSLTLFILCALLILAQIFYSSTDIWLKQWVNMEELHSANNIATRNASSNNSGSLNFEDLPTNMFHLTRAQCLYIYGSLIAICMFFTWNKLLVFFNTCIKASVVLHDNMFRGVTYAPMWFFHHNPSGRILNRFSRDLGQVDTLLPFVLVDCVGFFLEVVAILIVVCLVNWWLLLPTAVVALLFYLLRLLFVSTSRELRRIEAIVRSLSLNYATTTIPGLTTIRSTRERQRTLAQEFDKLQDLFSSSRSLLLTTNRAFGLWMDLVCCLYLAAVTFSFFLFTGADTLGGSMGLAITQVIGLVGMCQLGMKQSAEVENQMTSVERLLEYTNLPSEKPLEPDLKTLKMEHPNLDFENWPDRGEIIFENVSMQYEKPQQDEQSSDSGMKLEEPTFALCDVSFTISTGEKVAVVGRTGAGKSSLIAALFGLNKISGRVSVDGVTASQAGLRRWRSRLCALPQRPALFAASLRDNLDPERRHSDAQLHAALREVELHEWCGAQAGGLCSRLGDGGGALSAGQRQLLCLARAALRRRAVLVLDEATANVDAETDHHIQATVRARFAGSTVLTIAHRLNTVMDYDRVIVMDKGRVIESGHPFELLTQNQQIKSEVQPKRAIPTKTQAPLAIPENFTFESRYEERNTYSNRSETSEQDGGIFKSLVEQTGQDTAAMLYRMAEESYNNWLKKNQS